MISVRSRSDRAARDQGRPFDRDAMLERLRSEQFDVVVIGGGVTGAGVALDAVTRGLRTALIERDDFASGTSSRSSKLAHGGLRYLQNGDVRLVYQALHERQRLLRNAPHLVRPLPFVIPVLSRDGLISRRVARALGGALWMYDLTGGWRIGHRHRRLDAGAVLDLIPTLDRERVAGGYLYHDASVDDARLTLTLARTAADHGAAVVNRCAAVAITSEAGEPGPVNGVTVTTGGRTFTVGTRTVVSAAGVWADDVRAMLDPAATATLRPARGVHLTLPWELIRNRTAVVIPVPGDRRSLFVIPWGPRADGTFDHAYVGTTDTDHEGQLDDPPCTADDVEYVLGAVNRAFRTESPITAEHITAVWSGLRPLVRDAGSERTADLSRRHRVEVDARGLINISGGKLTTYREMAEHTVDAVRRHLGTGRRRTRTRRLALHGAHRPPRGEPVPASTTGAHLASRYGADAPRLERLIHERAELGQPLVPGLPYIAAEAVYAVTDEMATTLTDVLVRRTQAHYRDRAACEASAGRVAALMAPLLGWDEAHLAQQVDDYLDLCRRERAEMAEHRPVPAESG